MAETYPYKFGKYILLKPMARGGMGEIYLAATGEIGFQKFCVIKKVIAEKTDRVKANRFLDEAKVVLLSLQHTGELIEKMNNQETRAAQVPAGNGVADFLEPAPDGCFRDGLAHRRNLDFDAHR